MRHDVSTHAGPIDRRHFLWALGIAGISAFGQEVRYCKETHIFRTVGDCAIRADVYLPPVSGRRPAIVWIHGGALIMGHRRNIHQDQLELYLRSGYPVVSIDYRLAPEAKLKAILEDVQEAFRWVREKGPKLFPIDPDRLAVVGHSAGGYLTLMTGFLVRPRPKALVSFYGYGDIAGAWYSKSDPFYSKQPAVPKEEAYRVIGGAVISGTPGPHRRHRFYLYCRQNGLWPREVTGHDPDSEPGVFDPFCPVRNVNGEYPPTLLLHGDKDTDVPYQQSVLMAQKLSAAGVKHELITIPEGPHGFDFNFHDPVVGKAFEQVLAFLRENLR